MAGQHPRTIAKINIKTLIDDAIQNEPGVYPALATATVYRDRSKRANKQESPVVNIMFSPDEDEQIDSPEQTPGSNNYERRNVPIAIDVSSSNPDEVAVADEVDSVCRDLEALMAKNILLDNIMDGSPFQYSFDDMTLQRVSLGEITEGNSSIAVARNVYNVKYTIIKPN